MTPEKTREMLSSAFAAGVAMGALVGNDYPNTPEGVEALQRRAYHESQIREPQFGALLIEDAMVKHVHRG